MAAAWMVRPGKSRFLYTSLLAIILKTSKFQNLEKKHWCLSMFEKWNQIKKSPATLNVARQRGP